MLCNLRTDIQVHGMPPPGLYSLGTIPSPPKPQKRAVRFLLESFLVTVNFRSDHSPYNTKILGNISHGCSVHYTENSLACKIPLYDLRVHSHLRFICTIA